MIEIIKLDMINKGPLIARFSIKIAKWGGIVIRDCTFFDSKGNRWVSMPSREYESEGKKKYFQFIVYENQEMDKKFKETILQTLDEYMKKMNITKSREQNFEQQEFPF